MLSRVVPLLPWILGVAAFLLLPLLVWRARSNAQRRLRQAERRERQAQRERQWAWMEKIFGKRTRRLTYRPEEGD